MQSQLLGECLTLFDRRPIRRARNGAHVESGTPYGGLLVHPVRSLVAATT